MRKAIDRFWSWVFHPSILRQNYPDWKAVVPRYPSPANQPNTEELHDFREPFATSIYNIRYKHPTPAQLQVGGAGSFFVSDRLSGYSSWEEKYTNRRFRLVDFGFLKKGEESNKELVDKARQAFFSTYGAPVEKAVYRNDFGYKMPVPGNRESFRYVTELGVRSNISSIERLAGKSYQDLYNPIFFEIESLDMFAGDPDYQQCFLEVTYAIDNYCNFVSSLGEYHVVKGNRNFWKALDDTNDPANIVAVQSTVGDQDPLNFSLRDHTLKLVKDKQGKVMDVLP